jgi:hypothetical protein
LWVRVLAPLTQENNVASKGDKVLDFVTASWYNEVTLASRRKAAGALTPTDVDQNQYVTVFNHSTTAKRRWDAVSLGEFKLVYSHSPDPTHESITFNTKNFSSTDPHNIAILQESLPGVIGASAQALIVGSTWLHMTVDYDSEVPLNRYISYDASGVLLYSSYGRIEYIRDVQISDTAHLAFVTIGSLPVVPVIVRGVIADAFSGTPATFNVTPVSPISGTLPEGPIVVQNIYSWIAGAQNFVIVIYWNSGLEQWEPLPYDITNLQLDGTDFQYQRIGVWTTWVMGGSCP